MRIIDVIPARVLVNAKNGSRVSIYGAAPWTGLAGKADWDLLTEGWTWKLDNNTIGCGRVPVATEAEARAFMAKWNNRLDDAARESLPNMIAVNRARVHEEELEVAAATYPAAKNAAKRRLKEARARLAGCEARLRDLLDEPMGPPNAECVGWANRS